MTTLKQMEAFYWVGKLESFVAASEKLNLAQSTISKRIQELEEALGINLFNRNLRAGRLTLKGEELLSIAERMLRLNVEFREAGSSEPVLAGKIRIGVTEIVALTWLPTLMHNLTTRFPLALFSVVVDHVNVLDASLDDRALDVVIAPQWRNKPDHSTMPLASIEQAWMCKPDFYTGEEPVPISVIASMPLLLKADGFSVQAALRTAPEAPYVHLNSIVSCNSVSVLANLAAAGLGLTCLPRFYFEPQINAGRLRVLQSSPPMPPMQSSVSWRKDAIGSAGLVVSAMAKEVCDFSLRAEPF